MRLILCITKTSSSTIVDNYSISALNNTYQYHCQAVDTAYHIPDISDTTVLTRYHLPDSADTTVITRNEAMRGLQMHTVETREQTAYSFIEVNLTLEKKVADILLPTLENKLNSLYHTKLPGFIELEQHLLSLKKKCQYQVNASFGFFSKLGFYKDLAEILGDNLTDSDQIKLTLVSKDIAASAHQGSTEAGLIYTRRNIKQ